MLAARRTFRKLIACSRVVLVKLTNSSMASSGGSAMAARGLLGQGKIDQSMAKHDQS